MGSLRPSPAVPAGQPAATAVAANARVRVLNGCWLRPDGGYILDIRAVSASGTIEAVYLNPQPITVVRAEATRDGSTLNVFVADGQTRVAVRYHSSGTYDHLRLEGDGSVSISLQRHSPGRDTASHWRRAPNRVGKAMIRRLSIPTPVALDGR
jgi:hypothetical protein